MSEPRTDSIRTWQPVRQRKSTTFVDYTAELTFGLGPEGRKLFSSVSETHPFFWKHAVARTRESAGAHETTRRLTTDRTSLAKVLLIGFGHPDSARLFQELSSNAPQHQFQMLEGTAPDEVEGDGTVALIWCPRSSDETANMIAESVSVGLPTVALLHDSAVPTTDLSAGHIEFSFAPTDCSEALRRIDLVIARARGPVDRNVIRHGELLIDQDRYEVSLSGQKIDLTYKEYELLKYIAARPGRVFSREDLLRAVWDYDYFGGTRTVDVHVRRLRSKINDLRYQFIETVWNVGYRFRSPGDEYTKQES